MSDFVQKNVSPAVMNLAVDLLRSAARGLLAPDSAYAEICRRVEAAVGLPESAELLLPSRTWFENEIRRRKPDEKAFHRRPVNNRLATGQAAQVPGRRHR